MGQVSAAFIILFIPAPFWLITDDFGFVLAFLSIEKTSGAMVSQLQQPIHKLSSTNVNRFGCVLGSFVFSIDKNAKTNPKSSVINQKGAGINKIMNAAETCPTKAINVQNKDTNEKLFPF